MTLVLPRGPATLGVAADLWRDPAMRGCLDEKHQTLGVLYLFLLTCPESTPIPGVITINAERIAYWLQQRPSAVVKRCAELEARGMIVADLAAGLVWVPRAAAANLSTRRRDFDGWAEVFAALPAGALKARIGTEYSALLAATCPRLVTAFAVEVLGAPGTVPPRAPARTPVATVPAPAVAAVAVPEKPARKPRAAKTLETTPEWKALWALYPARMGGNNEREAYQNYGVRLKEGHSHEKMQAGLLRYVRYLEAAGKIGTEYVKTAAVFFGHKLHFEGEFPVATSKLSVALETSPDFERVFTVYPNKLNRPEAWEVWRSLDPAPDTVLTQTIVESIARWRQTESWRKQNGEFVPKLASFLRQRNWQAPLLQAAVYDADAIRAAKAKLHGGHAPSPGGNTFDGVATAVSEPDALDERVPSRAANAATCDDPPAALHAGAAYPTPDLFGPGRW